MKGTHNYTKKHMLCRLLNCYMTFHKFKNVLMVVMIIMARGTKVLIEHEEGMTRLESAAFSKHTWRQR